MKRVSKAGGQVDWEPVLHNGRNIKRQIVSVYCWYMYLYSCPLIFLLELYVSKLIDVSVRERCNNQTLLKLVLGRSWYHGAITVPTSLIQPQLQRYRFLVFYCLPSQVLLFSDTCGKLEIIGFVISQS